MGEKNRAINETRSSHFDNPKKPFQTRRPPFEKGTVSFAAPLFEAFLQSQIHLPDVLPEKAHAAPLAHDAKDFLRIGNHDP